MPYFLGVWGCNTKWVSSIKPFSDSVGGAIMVLVEVSSADPDSDAAVFSCLFSFFLGEFRWLLLQTMC
ncbi:MAG: hypothetical protein RMJ46_05305 [Bacteroidota bacterium]|nr:hypothetical protein [Bacteroidota bacterium]